MESPFQTLLLQESRRENEEMLEHLWVKSEQMRPADWPRPLLPMGSEQCTSIVLAMPLLGSM